MQNIIKNEINPIIKNATKDETTQSNYINLKLITDYLNHVKPGTSYTIESDGLEHFVLFGNSNITVYAKYSYSNRLNEVLSIEYKEDGKHLRIEDFNSINKNALDLFKSIIDNHQLKSKDIIGEIFKYMFSEISKKHIESVDINMSDKMKSYATGLLNRRKIDKIQDKITNRLNSRYINSYQKLIDYKENEAKESMIRDFNRYEISRSFIKDYYSIGESEATKNLNQSIIEQIDTLKDGYYFKEYMQDKYEIMGISQGNKQIYKIYKKRKELDEKIENLVKEINQVFYNKNIQTKRIEINGERYLIDTIVTSNSEYWSKPIRFSQLDTYIRVLRGSGNGYINIGNHEDYYNTLTIKKIESFKIIYRNKVIYEIDANRFEEIIRLSEALGRATNKFIEARL